MRLISERGRGGRIRWRPYAGAAAAVAAAATIGIAAADTRSAWYQRLPKPSRQPPPWAFSATRIPLYAGIAWSGGRAWCQAGHGERMALATALAVNLSLNAAWSWMFFVARSPRAGLAGALLLNASNVHLIRRAARSDLHAAAALLPYAAWSWFASALNARIAHLNSRP
ncbi:tryptophan-rich sensory protein [Actinacidiphila glaucinigra]|uniref:TspO/MBR family protein n=1 Tax=Actinacidiphila glaucinigra TaxID=235986 RepID=UPI002DDC6261|nr:TspO/MBR family protein [Actinacidiphila glaucinigra]WSD57603.1 tryptophan-rich sensory protein [Actinacidiphila glaucinigra]